MKKYVYFLNEYLIRVHDSTLNGVRINYGPGVRPK